MLYAEESWKVNNRILPDAINIPKQLLQNIDLAKKDQKCGATQKNRIAAFLIRQKMMEVLWTHQRIASLLVSVRPKSGHEMH